MKLHVGKPTTNPIIRAASRTLVATRRVPSSHRESNGYDSSDQLPSIAKLLDQTVQQIARIYLVRGSSQTEFDKLWDQVCKKLASLGNASAYARWKQHGAARNVGKFEELDAAAAEAWSAGLTLIKSAATSTDFALDTSQFQRLREESSMLKLDIEILTNDVLEVAIAYWIEAMNSHKDGDDLRAMHSLIPCHFHLGLAHSLRLTHDAKADDGRQAGQKVRDELADAVRKVMVGFPVTKAIRNRDQLLEGITHVIAANTVYKAALDAYDAQASAGKQTENDIETRFPDTLKTWVTGKNPLYPDLVRTFEDLVKQIKK